MEFKYKINDVAKEFGINAKKAIDTVSSITGTAYKTGGTFEEKELNLLLETLTKESAEPSFDAYFASGKKEEAPKPAPKKPEQPKAKPAPQAQPKAEQKPAQQPAKQEQRRDKRNEKQTEKRSEKRVTMQLSLIHI